MAITLNNYTFDPAFTSVREDQQEVAGQDGRKIRINGLLQGLADLDAIETALDAVLAAASVGDDSYLSIRPGRRLRVRREKFTREIQRDGLIGRFELILNAEDPFEESATASAIMWNLTASGDANNVTSAGTAPSPARITLLTTSTLVNPAFSDGTRTIAYSGVFGTGVTVEIDGILRQVLFDDNDITPYFSGEFPEIGPGTTTITYTDDASSAHQAQVTVHYNERWW